MTVLDDTHGTDGAVKRMELPSIELRVNVRNLIGFAEPDANQNDYQFLGGS